MTEGTEATTAGRPRGRSLRARLVLFLSVAMVVVCAAMALTTVVVQRVYLLGDLDQRVTDAAERGQGGLQHRRGGARDLGFLNERGQPVGTLAARFAADGRILAAEAVTRDGRRRVLTARQRAALDGIAPDGSLHTRTVPSLGAYRVTALGGDGVPVLAGLPVDRVQRMMNALVTAESVIAAVGLGAAACVSAVVVRRQLRPLGRVAATAAEVARAPLERGEVTGLTRVPARDTDAGTEVGQVGVALNHLIDHVEVSLAGRQRTEERMRRFLADAGHELRTPLASIAGYAELMDRGSRKIEPGLAWRRVLAQSARMTGRAKADAARVRMAEVRAHLDDTYVTWAGGTGDTDAFYVRVHSPVVWVEVDCQAPGPLAGAYGASQGGTPTQKHVHSIIRTPNGNDYGRELLRQHYLTSPHHR
ncbi:DUF3500 domain-containing protein [Streptomyces sp. NPDC001480]|uniref:DUF3500 domain-containing protein n=1 Tax=Streptomyces sp. NPDC001480 TaxID=3364577 RepID=UPI003681DE85